MKTSTIINLFPTRSEIWKDIYDTLRGSKVPEKLAVATANEAMGLPLERVDGIINIYKYV